MPFPPRTDWVLLDADDTILGVEIDGVVRGTADAYTVVLERFADAMVGYGFDRQRALDAQQRIDMEMARTVGFSDKSRFPRSFSMTYDALNQEDGVTVTVPPHARLEAIGWEVFAFPYRALPGALDAMARIHQHYNIAVVTKGEDIEQRKKVFESNCFVYADQVLVLGHKSADEWMQQVFTPLGLDETRRATAWAIGNSIKSDVNPPLALGCNGIHVAQPSGWAFEDAPLGTPLDGRQVHSTASVATAAGLLPRLAL